MILAKDQLLDLQKTASKAATEAGLYIQSQIDQSYAVQGKSGGDSLASQVVTDVDFNAQEIILEYLRPSVDAYDLGLLTEETIDDQSRRVKDHFWCIDPLDGTLPFTERVPGYAVSIALISKAGDPIIGVVYMPNEQVCYSAIKGGGVSLNGRPFNRQLIVPDNQLHWCMDRSFLATSHCETMKVKLLAFARERKLDLQIHSTFGAVANAVEVMTSLTGCYFKFPKQSIGGGSIWDYAATRLFFEELTLQVSNASGSTLHLNEADTTFMNHQGVVYATDEALKRFLVESGSH